MITQPTADQSNIDKPSQEMVLHRRRSCIKRSSSDAVKTVSWVDSQNWVSQITQCADDFHGSGNSTLIFFFAYVSLIFTPGNKWEETKVLYDEQVAKLDLLREQVEQGLERLTRETAHFEEVKCAILDQRDNLQRTYEDMERTRAHYELQGAYGSSCSSSNFELTGLLQLRKYCKTLISVLRRLNDIISLATVLLDL
jgi:hypothetical protein